MSGVPGETIRAAREEDLAAVEDIYNHYVVNSECTMQTSVAPFTERVAWFHEHVRLGLPVLLLVTAADEVLGWAALSRYSPREGYAGTVENSVYLRHDVRGGGRGQRLLAALLVEADALGFHRVLAKIAATQEASLALHRKLGFVEEGRLREVGKKLGRVLDVAFLMRARP